jgi:hypothetical protein
LKKLLVEKSPEKMDNFITDGAIDASGQATTKQNNLSL